MSGSDQRTEGQVKVGAFKEMLARCWLKGLALVLALLCWIVIFHLRNRARQRAGGLLAEHLDKAGDVLLKRVDPSPDMSDEWRSRGVHEIRWTGWVWVPYAGKFVFGVHFKGSCDLLVDGRTLIRDRTAPRRVEGHLKPVRHTRALRKNQVLLDKGWHELKLSYTLPSDGSKGMRLLWQPPGRRGPPEYLEPDFLRPSRDRPGTLGPSGHPKRDAYAGLSFLAVAAILLLVLFWRPLRAHVQRLATSIQTRQDLLIALVIALVAASARLVFLSSQGQTWDEDVYYGAGRNYLLNLLSLDMRPESWVWNLEHPPVTKYVVGLGSLLTESMTGPRVLMALLGSIAMGLAYLAGRRLVGRPAAALGASLAALLPHLVGHGKIAGHETATVAFFTASVLCYLIASEKVLERDLDPGVLCRQRTLAYLASGVFAGLALGVRWINASVLLLFMVYLFMEILPQLRKDPSRIHVHPASGLLFFVAVFVLFACWPRLWHGPVARLAETFGYYPEGLSVKEYFLGRMQIPPFYYFWVYFSATLPSLVLAAFLLFFGAWFANRGGSGPAWLLAWFLVPMLSAQISPFAQDGVRYIVAALVPASLMAGHGAVWIGQILGRASGRIFKRVEERRLQAFGVLAAATILLSTSAWACFKIHPYYIDFYNSFWGSSKGVFARKSFEIGWWGEGLSSATSWINRKAPSNSRIFLLVAARHIMVLRPDIKVIPSPGQADLIVFADSALYRPAPEGYRLVHAERAEGVCVVKVFGRAGL